MFNIHDLTRNEFMLTGPFARQGYDWWWHSFTGVSRETGKERTFFIEFFVCNPALAENEPVFGSRDGSRKPSYLMVKAGAWGEDAVQIHRFFSLKEAEIRGKAPFHVRAGNCFVSDTELRGSVHVTPEGRGGYVLGSLSQEGDRVQCGLRRGKAVPQPAGF